MSDKSSHSSSSKASGKSIKAKRAEKKASVKRTGSTDQVAAATKH